MAYLHLIGQATHAWLCDVSPLAPITKFQNFCNPDPCGAYCRYLGESWHCTMRPTLYNAPTICNDHKIKALRLHNTIVKTSSVMYQYFTSDISVLPFQVSSETWQDVQHVCSPIEPVTVPIWTDPFMSLAYSTEYRWRAWHLRQWKYIIDTTCPCIMSMPCADMFHVKWLMHPIIFSRLP